MYAVGEPAILVIGKRFFTGANPHALAVCLKDEFLVEPRRKTLRKWLFLFCSLLLMAIGSHAQEASPTLTLYGGYNFTHTDSDFDMNGFAVSGSVRATDNIYLKADFRTGFESAYGNNYHLFTYTAGPVYSFRAGRQVRPFAEVLIGGTTFGGAGASQNAFAMQFGGGLDVNRQRWGLRVVEVDYLYSHFGGQGQNNVQISSGLLFHF